MKIVSMLLKIVAALAALAGIVYVIATYGDKIVAWAKKLLSKCDYCADCECNCNGECTCECECENCDCEDCDCEESDEEVEVEVVAEEPAEEPAADEVVAAEADFEG